MKTLKILLIVLIITTIGLVMVYSASNIWAYYKFDDSLYYFKRQLIFLVLGLIMMYIFYRIDYHYLQLHYRTILAISIILMILVLIPGIGIVRGGSRSWFNLGVIAVQPSEIFKIAIIIYASNYLEEHYHQMKKLKSSIKLFVIMLIGFGLIMLQPDFGSGMVMVLSIMVMIMVSPFRFKYILMVGLCGVMMIVLMIVSAPYRLKRVFAFLNPFSDPLGSGFQMIQSLYAIAPGGILGVGFNRSIQKHFYLPEPQTDFIFAIFLEEFGLVGGIFLVTMYGILFNYLLKLSREVNDLFGSFLLIGITSMIGIQTLINILVVVGLIPVTGITLPLMSYGGTSLVITLIEIGIVLNISKSV